MPSLRVFSRHFAFLAGFLFLSVGCRTPGNDKPIGEVVAIKAPLGLPSVPIPADNPPTVQTIALGRKLFYDPRLSKDNTVSCASCHNPNIGFTDGLAIARGIGGKGWMPVASNCQIPRLSTSQVSPLSPQKIE